MANALATNRNLNFPLSRIRLVGRTSPGCWCCSARAERVDLRSEGMVEGHM